MKIFLKSAIIHLTTNRKSDLSWILLLLPALIGFVLIRLATHWGPGVGGDATIYIESARNLLAGNGLGLVGPRGEFRLLPYFPPFYSLLIAALGWTGVDLVGAAHWLNITSFIGLIFLVSIVTLQVFRMMWVALAGGLLVALSPVLIPTYAWAMSEPLSFLFGFASLAALLFAMRINPGSNSEDNDQPGLSTPTRPSESGKIIFLFISALLAGLSLLTRYSSIAFLVTGVLGVIFLGQIYGRRRILDAIIYGITGAIPIVIWTVYDVTHTATVASRSFETGAGMASRLGHFWGLLFETMLFWLVPDSWIYAPRYPSSINGFLVPLLIILLFVWTILVTRKMSHTGVLRRENPRLRLGFLLLVFILAYLAVIFLVYITTYPPITIGSRMLSPVHLAVLWLTVSLIAISLQLWRDRRIFAFLQFALALSILWYGWRTVRIVDEYYLTGLGYTSRSWQNSQTIQAVKNLPPETLLISNETNAVLFLTGRPAYPLMEIYRDQPQDVFSVYGDGDLSADEPQRLFREGQAALVLFDTIDDQLVGLYGDRTSGRISALVKGLYRAKRGEDGGIFYYRSP